MARGVGLTGRHYSRDKDQPRHGHKSRSMSELEPMPRLILRILNRAEIAHWFRDFELLSFGMNQYLDEMVNRTHYSEKPLRAPF